MNIIAIPFFKLLTEEQKAAFKKEMIDYSFGVIDQIMKEKSDIEGIEVLSAVQHAGFIVDDILGF
mgnify:CR=1 FL=1